MAIGVDDARRADLVVLRASLEGPALRGLRWVEREGFHATLVFLGDVAPEGVGPVIDRVREAVCDERPFGLAWGGLSVFPDTRRATVLWRGIVDTDGKLARLQRRVTAALALQGFAVERRPFHPHVTLGRWRQPPSRQDTAVLLNRPLPDSRERGDTAWMVRQVLMMESRLTRGGSIYKVVEMLPLGEFPATAGEAIGSP